MKKIIATIILSIMSTVSFADGHSGKIDLKGFFVGDAKAILDDKGNMLTFTYEGIAGYEAQGGTTFGDKSSHYCLGAGTIPGKGVELGHCKIMFLDGDTAMIFYEIPLGKPMDGTFKCVSGTGNTKVSNVVDLAVIRVSNQLKKTRYTQATIIKVLTL